MSIIIPDNQVNLPDVPSELPATPTNDQKTEGFDIGLAEQISIAIRKKLSSEVSIEQFIGRVVDCFLQDPKEKYNDDFFFDIIKPLLEQIVSVKINLEKDIHFIQANIDKLVKENTEVSKTNNAWKETLLSSANALEHTNESISDVLAFYDVNDYQCSDKLFNPLRQVVVKTIPTTNSELFKNVHESLSKGYERNGKIISKERIAAYVVTKNLNKIKEI